MIQNLVSQGIMNQLHTSRFRQAYMRTHIVENLSHVRINGIRQTRKGNMKYLNQWFGPNVTVN